MNLIKYLIMAVFCTAFFLFSCRKEADLGKNFAPQNELSGAMLVDAFSLETYTVLNDSLPTNQPSVLLCGKHLDPEFGTITTQSFAQANLINLEGLVFGNNPKLDSIVLNLFYDYGYGDSSTAQTIHVHRLSESLTGTVYNNKSTVAYDATELGSKSVALGRLPGIIQIRLSDSLGAEFLKMPLSVTQNANAFKEQFKGIALIPGGQNAAVMGFSLIQNGCNIRLHFKDDSLTPQSVTYPITTEGFRFNSINADRSNTLIQSLSETNTSINTKNTNNLVYLQSGTGLRMKVEFPHIKKFLENFDKKIFIVKAELEIPLVGNKKLIPNSRIISAESNINNKIKSENNAYFLIPADGNPIKPETDLEKAQQIFEQNNRYTISCTSYIESVMNGSRENNGILLIPVGNQVSINRALVYGANNSTNKPKLKLYYSILD
jgi:hypothetical protein